MYCKDASFFAVSVEEHEAEWCQQEAQSANLEFGGDDCASGGEESASYGLGDAI